MHVVDTHTETHAHRHTQTYTHTLCHTRSNVIFIVIIIIINICCYLSDNKQKAVEFTIHYHRCGYRFGSSQPIWKRAFVLCVSSDDSPNTLCYTPHRLLGYEHMAGESVQHWVLSDEAKVTVEEGKTR